MTSLEEKKKEFEIKDEEEVYDKLLNTDRLGDICLRLYRNKEGKYTLQRFFPLGKNWEISVDVNEVDVSELLDKIVKLFDR